MALIRPQGILKWQPSDSADVVSYRIYQNADDPALEPTYNSPFVDVGLVLEAQLPIDGLPPVEGEVVFAVAAVDGAGNVSDLTIGDPVLIDVTPPSAPTGLVYETGF